MVSIRRRRLIAASSAVISKRRSKTRSRPSTPDTSSKSFRGKNGAVNGSPGGEFEVKRRPYQRKKNNTLCLRGVYFKNMKWQSAIKVGKKQVHLGTVSTKEDAAHLYDRAAYMCGRVPNFELSQTVKRELDALTWDEFLELTRQEIANKKMRRRIERQSHPQPQQQQQEQEQQLQQEQQQQQEQEQEQEVSQPPQPPQPDEQQEDEQSICKFSVEVQNFQCELLAQS